MADVIKEGDHVVLVKSFDSGNIKIIPVLAGSTVHYGKLHFDPSPLIGAQFGSVYEINGQTMTPVDNFEEFDNELSEVVSRKMTTLDVKSQFSQEKIIKKKKRRAHANVVTVMQPTLLHINEMLFARDKIGGLRADILAQLMTLSNIQNGTKCLVLDHNLGMITSAVMSRILPNGVCIQVLPDYESMCTTRKTMNMLNIHESNCADNLLSITLRDLHKVSKDTDTFEQDNAILQARSKEQLDRIRCRSNEAYIEEGDSTKKTKIDSETGERLLQTLLKKDSNREQRNRERILAARYLKQRSLDSLIIVVQNDLPISLLKILYPFIAPSKPFVIYSDIIEPLVECYQYLKSNSLAISLQLSESWLRRHQVLPDRTRPEMNVTGYGGYLLSGTKALYGELMSNCDISMDEATT